MSRITLIHWNAMEAEERAEQLRRARHDAKVIAPRGAADLHRLVERPPEAFVIDLGRLPTQGRDLGVLLRRRKATREVPILFVGGDPAKVAQVRRLLPDATFTTWRGIRGAVRRVIRHPPPGPVVPGTMAGYSGRSLVGKLGIRADSLLVLLGAPAGFEQTLGRLPDNVRVRSRARGPANRILLFAPSRTALARRFPVALRALAESGGIWIAWPKQASGVATDLTQAAVRRYGLEAGLVDYKICAIDDTWSGLLFTRRRADRSRGRAL